MKRPIDSISPDLPPPTPPAGLRKPFLTAWSFIRTHASAHDAAPITPDNAPAPHHTSARPAAHAPAYRVFSPNELADRNPNLVTRAALRYQIFSAVARVSAKGFPLAPNGLAPALVRKGRRVFLYEELWLAWMVGHDISAMSLDDARQLAQSLRR